MWFTAAGAAGLISRSRIFGACVCVRVSSVYRGFVPKALSRVGTCEESSVRASESIKVGYN